MPTWTHMTTETAARLRVRQDQALHIFLNQYLYPFSPFYRRLLDQHKIDPRRIKTVADLASVPLTSKADLVRPQDPEHFKGFILQPSPESLRRFWPWPKLLGLKAQEWGQGRGAVTARLAREFRPSFMTFTTGTTGKPVPFLYSRYDLDNLQEAGQRLLEVLGIEPEAYIVNMFPYAPHLAFWQVVAGGFRSGALILSTGGGKVMSSAGNIAAIERMRPAVIIGVPGYVYHVLRTALEQGRKMDYVRKVILGASRATPAFKRRLRDLLAELGAQDVQVLGTYGFTEARMAWGECPASGTVSSGYHLYPDKEIFEVIDPATGEVKGEGEDGELVYTSLDARASCVLRYRTGDFVKGGLTWAPCPHCGRTGPRISSDITRLSDVRDLQLSKVKGVLVNLNALAALFAEVEAVEEWQIELLKKNDDPFEMDEVHVYINTRDGVRAEAVTEDLKRRIQEATEITPNQIICLSREDIVRRLELETANKEKRIIDRRPAA